MNTLSDKMESKLTAVWVNFFSAAGIPSDVAASYALTFAENRIQNDMLLDLNKEYLRDMGITRMGDVIAILRHAKQVHETTARERVLSSAVVTNKVPVAAVAARSTAVQASSPASRILEHYTRNTPLETAPVAVKRKSLETSSDLDTDLLVKKSRLIRIGTPTNSVVTKVVQNKSTVFERLGAEPVAAATQTTEVTKLAPPKKDFKPIFARLGSKPAVGQPEVIPIQRDALKYEGILKPTPENSVKKMTVTASINSIRRACTMRADETPISVKEKIAVAKKSVNLPKEEKFTPKIASKSVKFSNTVQYKMIETNKKGNVPFTPVFNKPERRLSMPEPRSPLPKLRLSLPEPTNGIKARLGNKGTTHNSNAIATKNVFKRLGI